MPTGAITDLENRVRQALLTLFFFSFSLPVAIQQTALGCMLAFAAYWGWRARSLPATPVDRPLLGFFLALVLSALFCPSVWSSLMGLRKLWLVGGFFAVYACLASTREAWRLSRLAVVIAIGVAAYGIIQHYTGFDLGHWVMGKRQAVNPFWFGREEGFRTEGLFPTGITYAHNLIFPLTVLTVWLMGPRLHWRTRLGLFLGWVVMLLALLFSLTRGVWVAYVVVLLVFGGIKGGRVALAVGASLVLIGLAVTTLNPGVWERARYTFDPQMNLSRSLIWQANLDMIKERPLLGWGYGNYKRFRDVYYQRYPGIDTTAHAHNNFLQMWVDGGVIGLGAFLFLFWSILKLGWCAHQRLPEEATRLRILALSGFLSTIGFLVGGLTQYNFGDAEVTLVMWATVGMLTRVYTWSADETSHGCTAVVNALSEENDQEKAFQRMEMH